MHQQFSGGRETLSITYETVSTVENPLSPRATIEGQILAHQEAHLRAEIESGQCLTGPHRDDFEVLFNGLSLKSFGSQGQVRTAAISLKLSEREIFRDDTGEEPRCSSWTMCSRSWTKGGRIFS